MITQRRQANKNVSVCMCTRTGTAGAPERNNDGKHDKRKNVIKLETSANFIGLQG